MRVRFGGFLATPSAVNFARAVEVVNTSAKAVFMVLSQRSQLLDPKIACLAWASVLSSKGVRGRVICGKVVVDDREYSDHLWIEIGGQIFDPCATRFQATISDIGVEDESSTEYVATPEDAMDLVAYVNEQIMFVDAGFSERLLAATK